jgi:peptidoglycan/LPS O-acetylase OafA/YrhL
MRFRQLNDRSLALDACRGLAVLAVIAYHLRDYGFYPSPPAPFTIWPVCGMFGVDLFYVLSGFFITQAILRPATWQPSAFLQARVTRIYPAYLFSLFIVVAAKIGAGAVVDPNLIAKILLHVTMLHNFLGVGGLLNGVYWTLGVEFPYYLLMLALAPFLRNNRSFWLVSLTMVVISVLWRAGVFYHIPSDINRVFAGTQLPGALDAFALGGVAAMLNQTTGLTQILRQWRWPLLITSTIGLAFSLHYFSNHAGNYWSDGGSVILWRSGLAACCSMLVLACAKMRHSKVLAYSSLPWFGKISFSLYLYHLLPILAINHYLADQAWSLKLLLAITITLLVSWASWRFVETPFHLRLVQKSEKTASEN